MEKVMNSGIVLKNYADGTKTDNRRHIIRYLNEKIAKFPPIDGEAYAISEDWPYLWRKQPNENHLKS